MKALEYTPRVRVTKWDNRLLLRHREAYRQPLGICMWHFPCDGAKMNRSSTIQE
jgi:hypothetical protein